jgi:pimeloyl-ACP methyl ester carboxylesterase
MKKLLLICAILLAIAGGAAALLMNGAFTLSLAKLEKKYALPQSKFMDIDGVHLHYTDEGQGPAVVLVHASYMSLHSWNQLAASLSTSFRVIRLDMLGAGLTGPDPKADYSMEHNQRLVDQLTRRLGIEKFALLGTSSGGVVAFRYAAAHPERVTRLILVNSAGMPRTAATDPNRARGNALSRWVYTYFKPRIYWRQNLALQFGGGALPPEDLVQRVYDFNRRDTLITEGAAMLKSYRTGDPEATLAKITAPSFILWGEGNITVSHLEANVIQHWLVAAPTLIKKYPKVGHYLYLEIPDEFAADIAAFLSGARDAEMIRVMRMVGFAP